MAAAKRPSVKDVAALAGVAVGTVSNVLNRPDIVAEPTRRAVEDAIATLGFTRNESARQLRAGASRSIAMVVMDVANPFFTDLYVGAESFALERGYSIQLGNSGNSGDREQQQLAAFEQQRVRGVLLAPIAGAESVVERLREHGIPTVLVDRVASDLEACSVAVDDVEGGRLAVGHLIAEGHRRIAFVGGPADLQQIRDRVEGARRAVAEAEGTAEGAGSGPVELVIVPVERLDAGDGRDAAGRIVAQPVGERPTAVFAANDLLSLGLLQGFVAGGLRVPEDIALIGYDDIDFAATAAVPLSAVRQPRREIGYAAGELLFREIEDMEAGAPHVHQHVRFVPELVVRRSSSAEAPAA
ncbi:LacI family DNA-binding transcriptional regulator [Leifsonia sp. NPDC058194]|uniref:LacI family DNA-binding transcriptional regulator n=1 Tax=Leifsonia sp. NPDC058194 TaxID=3346374 RepID=UPI0036D9EEAF